MFGGFDLFTVSGIRVRSNITIILLILIGAQWFGWGGAVGLILTVFLHEMGHAIAARRCGAMVNHISIGIVGLAQYSGNMSSKNRAWVAFAGPLANLLTAVVCGVLLITPISGLIAPLAFPLLVFGVALGIFNLIPALPADGGWIVQHLLELKYRENEARVKALKTTMVTSIVLIIVGLTFSEEIEKYLGVSSVMLVIFAVIFMFMAYPELKARTEFSGGFNFFEQMRERMHEAQQHNEREQNKREVQKQQESDIEIRARIDQLLTKISKEGMSSLTQEERDYLTNNSNNYPRS